MDEKDQEIAHCRIVAIKPKTRGIQDKSAIRHGQACGVTLRSSAFETIPRQGVLISVQPRIRLGRLDD